jgi:hypothetical protein
MSVINAVKHKNVSVDAVEMCVALKALDTPHPCVPYKKKKKQLTDNQPDKKTRYQ